MLRAQRVRIRRFVGSEYARPDNLYVNDAPVKCPQSMVSPQKGGILAGRFIRNAKIWPNRILPVVIQIILCFTNFNFLNCRWER